MFPSTSAPVTSTVGSLAAPSIHENAFDTYGPPDGVDTELGVCVQPAVVPPSTDVALEAGPVPASVRAFRSWKVPPAPPPFPR